MRRFGTAWATRSTSSGANEDAAHQARFKIFWTSVLLIFHGREAFFREVVSSLCKIEATKIADAAQCERHVVGYCPAGLPLPCPMPSRRCGTPSPGTSAGLACDDVAAAADHHLVDIGPWSQCRHPAFAAACRTSPPLASTVLPRVLETQTPPLRAAFKRLITRAFFGCGGRI